jgi:RNA polymerase sigma-70 factor, ECF subfamily
MPDERGRPVVGTCATPLAMRQPQAQPHPVAADSRPPGSSQSDQDLFQRWLAGQPGSFDPLLTRHSGALLVHARALLGDAAAAEDVVQEAFLRLLARPPEVRAMAPGESASDRSPLSSWLHRVTHNLCMDALRSNRRRQRREAENAPPEATDGGLLALEREDTRLAVERGLERLPAEQREVLALRLFGEQSYKEIAALTGKKIGTVGWLIAEGIKALSRDLAHLLPLETNHNTVRPERAR